MKLIIGTFIISPVSIGEAMEKCWSKYIINFIYKKYIHQNWFKNSIMNIFFENLSKSRKKSVKLVSNRLSVYSLLVHNPVLSVQYPVGKQRTTNKND